MPPKSKASPPPCPPFPAARSSDAALSGAKNIQDPKRLSNLPPWSKLIVLSLLLLRGFFFRRTGMIRTTVALFIIPNGRYPDGMGVG